jgi:hypothetical protein
MEDKRKEYMGDSVYAEVRQDMLTLTVENGYGPTETIHLEPFVIRAILAFIGLRVTSAETVMNSEQER